MRMITPPVVEPVTVAEAKLAARISGAGFDPVLPGLIAAARELAEQDMGRWLIAQTQRVELADWPDDDELLSVFEPTACAITYWTGGAWASLAGGAFVFAAAGPGTVLAPATGTSWPALGAVPVGPRVRVDLTAGAADATGVAEAVKLFIKACVAFWIDNPQAVATNGAAIPMHLSHLLDRQRVYF